MIAAQDFLAAAGAAGFDFYTGVPCSYLTPLINGVLSDRRLAYVGAASEGEAVAIAAGAWLAGRRTVVMCQNSGLGNAVNPLTSLNAPFAIPTLFITTWRGRPGEPDEPQHALMGEITPDLLDLMRLPRLPFPEDGAAAPAALAEAARRMEADATPVAMVLRKGAVADTELDERPVARPAPGQLEDRRTGEAPPSREAVLRRVLEMVDPAAAVVATTGKTGRELFTLEDREQHLYQVGSMGGALGMGLGLALNTLRRVVVLDGDGAALMKLGTWATVGARQPAKLVQVLLDNGVHDSTGGQATVSPAIDFPAIALACGYGYAAACDDLEGFAAAFAQASAAGRPALVHVRIAPGSMSSLGRPTVTPREVARRFRAFVTRPLAGGAA